MNPKLDEIVSKIYPEYAELPVVEDINADENPREDFLDNLSEQEMYDINAEYLKQTADPKYDYLTCWEPGRIDEEKETLFDFPTFYEFDVAWWEFQKEAEYESLEEYKQWMENGSDHWTPERVAEAINRVNEKFETGYEMYCTGDWFRLIDNGTFLYSQIISAKWYIYYRMESLISDLQDKYLPYSLNEDEMEFIEILNCDDPERKYKASGRELELESLQEKIRKYEGKPLLDLIDNCMKKYDFYGMTFRYDKGYGDDGEKFDPFTDFIFWDEQSLKNVRTTHFLEDFKNHQEDNSLLETIIEKISKEVTSDFMEFYNENKSRYLSK